MPAHPTIRLPSGQKPEAVFRPPLLGRLEELLPGFLARARWFGGKARELAAARVAAALPLPGEPGRGRFLVVAVSYRDGGEESYLLPLVYTASSERPPEDPGAVLAGIEAGGEATQFVDAVWDRRFREGCFDLIFREETLEEGGAALRGTAGKTLRDRAGGKVKLPASRVLGKEQSNTSLLFGREFILKLYRRPENGVNPEVEITRFLTEQTDFDRIPAFAGTIELRLPGRKTFSAALLQSYVPHQDDGWSYTLGEVSRFLAASTPQEARRTREGYLAFARKLGERTAQLHRALASNPGDRAFATEPETTGDRESAERSARELLDRGLAALAGTLDRLDGGSRKSGWRLLAEKDALRRMISGAAGREATGGKIRIHGDYHLGQLLRTGDDAVIIDFEGEPARPLEERRRKRSPLVDAAGMVRSFHYAALGAIFLSPRERPDPDELFSRAGDWYRAVSRAFLDSYRRVMAESPGLLPAGREEEDALLALFLLEKAAYELNYELNNRPDWAIIPLRGLEDLLRRGSRAGKTPPGN